MAIQFKSVEGCGGILLDNDNSCLGIIGASTSGHSKFYSSLFRERRMGTGEYLEIKLEYNTNISISNKEGKLEENINSPSSLLGCIDEYLRNTKEDVILFVDNIISVLGGDELFDLFKLVQLHSNCYIIYTCDSDTDSKSIELLPIGHDFIICRTSRDISQTMFGDTRASSISTKDLGYYKSRTVRACTLNK